jgi:hypothetical protein
MRWILLAACTLTSAFLVGQEMPIPGPKRDPNPQATQPRSYQGCVIRSNGQVMLVDASNADYKLVSSAHPLDGYVGQEVRITASPISPGDPSSDDRAASREEAPQQPATLDVEDIAKVADHCSSPK